MSVNYNNIVSIISLQIEITQDFVNIKTEILSSQAFSCNSEKSHIESSK